MLHMKPKPQHLPLPCPKEMPVYSEPLSRLIIQLASHPQLRLVRRERRVPRVLRPRQFDEGRPDWGRGRRCHLRVSRVPNAVRTSHPKHLRD